MEEIEKAFDTIPSAEILQIASSISERMRTDSSLLRYKDRQEHLTQADIEIQQLILDHFANSALAGSYCIKAEEQLSAHNQALVGISKPWQLIVDPIDGTRPFANGEKTWGSMVGLCDSNGRMVYSWTLVSSGEIYSSANAAQKKLVVRKTSEKFNVDVCDYGGPAIEFFSEAFEKQSQASFLAKNIEISTYHSAAWAGWELFNQRLDGLLWLPSTLGKRHYPDYDMTFVGALKQQGWKVALGRRNELIQLAVVARTEEELELLWNTGLAIVSPEMVADLEYDTTLKITAPC